MNTVRYWIVLTFISGISINTRFGGFRYIEKFSDGDIAQLLGEILRLLNSPIAPTEDINCIKSECLCLDCPAASICESRCKRCVDWRGQYPVKMCAVRVQFGKLKGG